MHTVHLMERALDACRRAGYSIRQEWLGGTGGGICEISGRKWVFVDLAMTPDEQWERLREDLQALGELAGDTSTTVLPVSRQGGDVSMRKAS